MTSASPEAWLRGPVPGLPALVQPVAHALLQAREEVAALLEKFPDERLWTRPEGVASVGFHLLHLSGVVDRLFTYARGEALSPPQVEALSMETMPQPNVTAQDLVTAFFTQVDRALDQLRATDDRTLTESRTVGRARLPSTVLGLLVHTAEHVQRHVGQLLVTIRAQERD